MRASVVVLTTLLISTLNVVGWTGASLAQSPGDIVSPKAPLPLRDAPPDSLIGLKGDTIGTVEPSSQYKVIDQRNFSTVFGGQKWLKVESVNSDKTGWVYSGTPGGREQNLTPVR
jgi:hypothetical protein